MGMAGAQRDEVGGSRPPCFLAGDAVAERLTADLLVPPLAHGAENWIPCREVLSSRGFRTPFQSTTMASLRTTRQSLFGRIGRLHGDPGVWKDFVGTYGPAVVQWCRGRGLQEADAHDVAQDVLIRFWRHSRDFRYDPSLRFRSYLRRMVIAALSDWSEARRADRLATGIAGVETVLGSVPARAELIDRIEKAFDLERLSAAMREVEARVKPSSWQAFHLLAIEQRSGPQVAEELGISVTNAYMARMRVQRLIGDAIRRQDLAAAPG
jgi:RNA polymerase sigma factor (sigma-70 family)